MTTVKHKYEEKKLVVSTTRVEDGFFKYLWRVLLLSSCSWIVFSAREKKSNVISNLEWLKALLRAHGPSSQLDFLFGYIYDLSD